jgi:TetR/AcrR family transcriptional regulator, fatty acid biosynthesis regulator
MATAAKLPRRRLNPEARRALILDHTADIVAREGVAQLSVERIGKEAGISKSLVYAYFPNLTELLRELYLREMKRFRSLQAEAANKASTFEGLVRSITHVYLTYMDERGLLIERLQAEPSVSEAHDPTEYSRDRAVDYLTEIVVQHFDLPRDIARAATDISFGLPASAGTYLQRNTIDLKTLEDLTVTMIIGSVVHLKDEYAVRRQPLPRQDG